MKILFLTPRLPYPPRKGDQVVTYNRLRTLSTRHEITLLTFTDGIDDLDAEIVLRQYCARIIRIPHPKWRIAWNLLSKGIWSSIPLQVIYYWSPGFRAALTRLLAIEQFDLMHVFLVRLRPYIEKTTLPVMMEYVDSMRLNLSRQVSVSRGWRRWLYKEEQRRMDSYEPSTSAYVDSGIFVSDLDANYAGYPQPLVLKNGVEIPDRQAICEGTVLAFSGNMGYLPNIQAVQWFVNHCWSTIRARHPKATFRILGDGAPGEILQLARIPGVELKGFVPNMAEALLDAAIAVAPMQSGSGIQNKILEAMACGLPVVTSTIGLGPIAATPGKEILVADSPREVIDAICYLLENHEIAKSIGAQGRRFVSVNHSWEKASEQIEFEWLRMVSIK